MNAQLIIEPLRKHEDAIFQSQQRKEIASPLQEFHNISDQVILQIHHDFNHRCKTENLLQHQSHQHSLLEAENAKLISQQIEDNKKLTRLASELENQIYWTAQCEEQNRKNTEQIAALEPQRMLYLKCKDDMESNIAAHLLVQLELEQRIGLSRQQNEQARQQNEQCRIDLVLCTNSNNDIKKSGTKLELSHREMENRYLVMFAYYSPQFDKMIQNSELRISSLQQQLAINNKTLMNRDSTCSTLVAQNRESETMLRKTLFRGRML